MLEITDLTVSYGSAVALDGISLRVEAGEMVALVGPNGAGKSTLVNTICGLVRPAAGTVRVDGRVAQVPEGRQMFADMSVEDNLLLGAWSRRGPRDLSEIYELLPDLVRLKRQRAGTLSGGQQQMVSIGRALMARPELLVIDELSLGLAPIVVGELADHLVALNRDRGTTLLLIEQEVGLAFRLCARSYVLEAGRIVASGDSARLRNDPVLRKAYFGEFGMEGGAQ
jgi:branched-chain amino acid transport system ATP-binding protein